jgi:hypothetical protein
MYWKTQKATYARALIDAFLAALTAAPDDPLLATPKAVLFTTGPSIGPDFAPADYTAPTFHGYAATALTFTAPINLGGTDLGVIATANFVATAGGAIDDTCNGYMIVDTTLAVPYMIELFANPVSFGHIGDFLQLDVVLPLPMVYTPTIA